MVTKAIERAQTTVEQRNAEIRKNVLKYDEVMNEQRKVIYQRRDQILEGVDLRRGAGLPHRRRRHAHRDALRQRRRRRVGSRGPGQGAQARSGRPRSPRSPSPTVRSTKQMRDVGDGGRHRRYYALRETELGESVMREVERQVMLRIIDQRWREHLEEMDYLQEGINLRAMGQKDPLTEWQREGYEMFGSLMKGIAQDFVRYVMHVEVVKNEAPAPAVQNMQESSSDDDTNVRLRPRRGGRARRTDARVGELPRLATSVPLAVLWRRVLRRSRSPSCATTGRRPRATPRAPAARARSSSSATAPEPPHSAPARPRPETSPCVTSPTI